MSSEPLQSLYFRFLQNQINRSASAYRRSSRGTYGFDDWFRDWTECAADVYGVAWAPVREILDAKSTWEFRAKVGEVDVLRPFFYPTGSRSRLRIRQPFKKGTATIPFHIKPDPTRRIVTIHIPSIPAGTATGTYLAKVTDTATREKLTFLLKVR